MIKIFSSGIEKIEHLSSFLEEEMSCYGSPDVEAVIGWGHKPTAHRARAFAKNKKLPYIALEDGFLRSLDLGVNGASPIGLTVDSVGVYYDATEPSQIEIWLNSADEWMNDVFFKRAQEAIHLLIEYDLSKYNASASLKKGEFRKQWDIPDTQRCVLVIDQTVGDASVELGLASASSFDRMLKDAVHENPQSKIFIKTHPDVLVGKKEGFLTGQSLPKNVTIIDQAWASLSFLKEFDRVYTVTSQMGFEALMLGKEVFVYGCPFYAGWGLTYDRGEIPSRRGKKHSLETLFAAAYIRLSRYVSPVTGMPLQLEEAIDFLNTQRQCNERNRGLHIAMGFRRWKHEHVQAFMSSTDGKVEFVQEEDLALNRASDRGGDIVVWSSRCCSNFLEKAKEKGIKVWRMEDGFLRSTGLGSDFNTPYSLVLDSCGIYYDPRQASELEKLLLEITDRKDFARLVQRAEKLRDFLIKNKLSKYNLVLEDIQWNQKVEGKKIILIPGQVDGDASVINGGGKIQSNFDLIRAVRKNNPNAYIIYKPHPDVQAKNRPGNLSQEALGAYVDYVAEKGSLDSWLRVIDELHTLTSLSGFEALIRGITVYTYGKPFYAGWGLTRDFESFPTRKKNLTIAALIAGTLVLYPRYWDWRSHQFCRPEDVCELFIRGDLVKPKLWVRFCRLFRNIKKLWCSYA